jgi:phage gpG-like protein
MITLDISTAGGKRESIKLRNFKASMFPNLIRGINKATLLLEQQIKLNLSKGGTYEQQEGEPWLKNPATGPLTLRRGRGDLQRSWKIKPAKRVSGGVEGHVMSAGTGSVYSRIHELGGNAGPGRKVRLPARPYVQPAIDDKRDEMVRDITGQLLEPLR